MKKILIADDNDDMRQLVKILLLKEGDYAVTDVSDGLEALRAYGTALRAGEPYTLLVLDCAMPNMTGTAVAGRVRELCDDVPIVFMTAHAPSLLSDDIARLRIADVFEKPIKAKGFVGRIAALLCGNQKPAE